MFRNWPIAIIWSVSVILLAIALLQGVKPNPPTPSKKPPAMESDQQDNTGEKTKWYIQFTAKNQKLTAYTEETGAPQPASAGHYFLGTGAVHPSAPLQSGGNALQPILPFNTVIYFDQPVNIQGQNHKTLIINDTGDVHYGLWPNHPYWVDIYFGSSNNYSLKAARQFGVKTIDYHWYEPWQ